MPLRDFAPSRQRKRDGNEIIDAGERHSEHWLNQPVDVYLVIHDAEKKIRWMNVTDYPANRSDKTSRRIVFSGNVLNTEKI